MWNLKFFNKKSRYNQITCYMLLAYSLCPKFQVTGSCQPTSFHHTSKVSPKIKTPSLTAFEVRNMNHEMLPSA